MFEQYGQKESIFFSCTLRLQKGIKRKINKFKTNKKSVVKTMVWEKLKKKALLKETRWQK